MRLKIKCECMNCNTFIFLEKDRDGINCTRCCVPVIPKPYDQNIKPSMTIKPDIPHPPVTPKHKPLLEKESNGMPYIKSISQKKVTF